MAIITYTSGTLTVGEETFDLGVDLGVEVIRYEPVLTRDDRCRVCGARDETWSDGSLVIEPCAVHAHASARSVGPKRCLCGHPESEHLTIPSPPGCMLCAELGDDCDRYRASKRREARG